jgi:hypothetical protein
VFCDYEAYQIAEVLTASELYLESSGTQRLLTEFFIVFLCLSKETPA